MRLIICGSRDYIDKAKILEFIQETNPDVIIAGGAKGADKFAAEIAVELNIKLEEYFPNWQKYGNRGGLVRNTRMLSEGKPDMVAAFFAGRRTAGTAHMVSIAKKARVPTIEFGLEVV